VFARAAFCCCSAGSTLAAAVNASTNEATSWQRARALAPTHQLLEDVTAYEQRLEADHPEYFRLV